MQAWNAQRSMALERALNKSIFPQLEKELKMKLVEEAKEGILRVGSPSRYVGWSALVALISTMNALVIRVAVTS